MKDWQNLLLYGDCLDAINKYGDMLLEQVRLIYIDPPFFSGTDYTLKSRSGADNKSAGILKEQDTYSDKWDGGLDEYLEFMKARLEAMKPLLREDGSLWVHLDWHVSHYVKVMLDEIFGYSNFVNEIVWRRTNSPKVQSRGFGSQHDVILIYAADASKFKINQIYRDHDEKSRRPYSYEDKRGKFRLIEIEAQGIQRTESRKQFEWRGRKAPFLYRKEILEEWWKKDLIYTSKNGRHTKKQYLSDVPGIPVSDLWIDIPPLQGQSKENTGFLTQKPEALITRVIESASEADDIVVDFFAGSGTTAMAAITTNRRWILCDSSEAAVSVSRDRIENRSSSYSFEKV
ncbi:MAG: site-specific DNA-methyltransferase [Candidatus Thorarchaeota archaeon]|jgi:adenine-specific DNA-methyltransferase